MQYAENKNTLNILQGVKGVLNEYMKLGLNVEEDMIGNFDKIFFRFNFFHEMKL